MFAVKQRHLVLKGRPGRPFALSNMEINLPFDGFSRSATAYASAAHSVASVRGPSAG